MITTEILKEVIIREVLWVEESPAALERVAKGRSLFLLWWLLRRF